MANRIQSEIAQMRILCVDDNLLELTLRGKILELQGYAVVLLRCPIQALRCDLSTFDLAILGFDMPGMNGRDLLLRMRALHARFPILLLSCSAVIYIVARFCHKEMSYAHRYSVFCSCVPVSTCQMKPLADKREPP